jgi:hypothetical protein
MGWFYFLNQSQQRKDLKFYAVGRKLAEKGSNLCPLPCSMQLHTGADHFGNVIFRYSELTSQYHIDASIHVYHTGRARDKTIVSQSGTVAVRNSFLR